MEDGLLVFLALAAKRLPCGRTWDVVLDTLRVDVRYEQGRRARPTAASIDSQSVKSTEKGGLADTMEAKSSADASV